ncbi:F1 complex, OSCP/delta subunit of ATPase [Tuber magnatum]|uniref:ATP synthase subunit 5, mitochondrial n=1 Tax=Tuber magnatum TaxID=42249 RepID=A0A317SHP8_9PEZI|nr:F1 complex, OSCP/delta subunit of ATPase [Tuber magnatum]
MFPIRSAFIARAIVPRVGRAYATASIRPPVQLFGVDGTYASALYTACAKAKALESTEKSLQRLKTLLQKDPKLETIISSPTFSSGDKSQIIAVITKPIASDAAVKNLLEALAENNRLGLLRGVIDKYSTLMDAHKGVVEAVITSASQLEPRIISRLESAISKSQYVGAGKTLKVVNKVNPEILGGLIVEIDERTVDLSVSAKMARLNKLLTDAL